MISLETYIECEFCVGGVCKGHGDVGLDLPTPAEDEGGEGRGLRLGLGGGVPTEPESKHHAADHLHHTDRLRQSSLHTQRERERERHFIQMQWDLSRNTPVKRKALLYFLQTI